MRIHIITLPPPPFSPWRHSDNYSNQYILSVSRAVAIFYLRNVSLIRSDAGVSIILFVNVASSASTSNSDDLKILSNLRGKYNKWAS